MDDVPQTSAWGSLALVSYIPEPLGSFLNRLRRSLTDEACPFAHVTVLPPRPLQIPVELASQQVLSGLSAFEAFPVELSSVYLFRETNVFYVGISEGSHELHAIHDVLNDGDLVHAEPFEFLPHLTLTNPALASDLEPLRQLATQSWDDSALNRRFPMEELACLWLPPGSPQGEWCRLWSYCLKTRQTIHQPPTALAATSQTY